MNITKTQHLMSFMHELIGNLGATEDKSERFEINKLLSLTRESLAIELGMKTKKEELSANVIPCELSIKFMQSEQSKLVGTKYDLAMDKVQLHSTLGDIVRVCLHSQVFKVAELAHIFVDEYTWDSNKVPAIGGKYRIIAIASSPDVGFTYFIICDIEKNIFIVDGNSIQKWSTP